jgi:hypothetical protein
VRKQHGKSHGESRPAFDKARGPKTKKDQQAWPDNDGRRHAAAPAERSSFKKKKKKHRG